MGERLFIICINERSSIKKRNVFMPVLEEIHVSNRIFCIVLFFKTGTKVCIWGIFTK
jgi:hypothetical protein